MSAKELVIEIAREMNMHAEDFQKYVDLLDSNLLKTQLALKDLDSEDWKTLQLPIGLSS